MKKKQLVYLFICVSKCLWPCLCVCACLSVSEAKCQSALPASQLFSPWAASSSVENAEQSLHCKLKNTKEEHVYFTELCTSRHHREGHKQYLEQSHTSCIWTSNTWLDTLCSLITSSENVTCGWIIASRPNVNKLFSHSPLTNKEINLRFSRTTQWNRIRISAEEGCII